MEYHSSTSHRLNQPALICRICGDVARGMNFDVISCMSCKAFFRRHALKYTKKLQCPLNENCDITKISRGGCAACRLRKCFTIGMNPKLIRSCNKPLKLVALPQLKPCMLLNHDRSTLTVDEWNLLSNIIHAYDEQEPVAHAKRTLQKQSILPAKLRTKKSSAFELISTMYTSIQPFIERSPYFRNMPADLRRIILQNNFAGVAGVNGCMIGAEADVFANEDYVNACNEIYGVEYVRDVRLSLKRYETNQNLLKLILIILTFSSNASVTGYDPSVVLTIPSYAQTLYLLRTQDMFITMLWKYIVYLYGYIDGIKKMNGLVKNLLQTLDQIHAIASKQHWDMVDHIVKETFNSLSIDS